MMQAVEVEKENFIIGTPKLSPEPGNFNLGTYKTPVTSFEHWINDKTFPRVRFFFKKIQYFL